MQCHVVTHSTKLLSQEKQTCEVHFKENTQRNFEGRYIVRLPFNENKEKLGESRHMALRRFKLLKKRFERNLELKSKYCDVLDKYKNLNHLSLIKNENLTLPGFYLLHHAVMKENTKIRVVFDGSAKTSTSGSLNDMLMVSPMIQDDLLTLLTRFR